MITTNDTIFPYKITNDVILKDYDTEGALAAIDRTYPLIQGDTINAKAISKIKQAIQQHPQHPTLKNYLQNAYLIQGKVNQAIEWSKKIIKDHPDYLFAKINLALVYIRKQQDLQKANELIPNPTELNDLEPNRTLFHISEVLTFEQYTIEYYHQQKVIEEIERRETRLKQLSKAFRSHSLKIQPLLHNIERFLMTLRMEKMIESMQSTDQVEATFKEFYPVSDEVPVFHHEIIHEFYIIEPQEISQNFIDKILALPRQTLIEDLRTILIDVQRRFHLYEAEENYNYAHVHAMYFLATLKAYDSLQEVLNLTRQDEDFYSFYFEDYSEYFLEWPLYHLAQNQLVDLKAYMLEENNFTWFRGIICRLPAQVALLQPERQQEVVKWYKEVLQYHIDHRGNVGINDGFVISEMVRMGLEIEAKELIPLVNVAYEQDLVPHHLIGDLEVVLEEFETPISSDVLMAELDMVAMYAKFEDFSLFHHKIKKEGYKAHFAKFKEKEDNVPSFLNPLQKLFNKNTDDRYQEEPWEKSQQSLPNRDKKYGRNDKVTVKYADGKMLKNVKFKKIEDDWNKGLCEITS